MLITSPAWPWKLWISWLDSTSQRAQVLSPLPVRIWESGRWMDRGREGRDWEKERDTQRERKRERERID